MDEVSILPPSMNLQFGNRLAQLYAWSSQYLMFVEGCSPVN